ncbi:MAG: GIY-YIG nuclease family protein [bacterium]|nr:GIY-YIG nuclease family protein [bacterium]
MPWFVYILKSLRYKKTYVGMTCDLKKRLHEHNRGQSFYTKAFRPWKLIYLEKLSNVKEARKKEKYFKSCAGRKIISKLLAQLI